MNSQPSHDLSKETSVKSPFHVLPRLRLPPHGGWHPHHPLGQSLGEDPGGSTFLGDRRRRVSLLRRYDCDMLGKRWIHGSLMGFMWDSYGIHGSLMGFIWDVAGKHADFIS